jgi:hypothetical protein
LNQGEDSEDVYRQINQVRLQAQWDAMKEKVLTPDAIIDTTGSIVASTTP